ncbi:MAG: bifunctional 4-hydroxy-3-methylbut-2-enyl diphosphate reductase/30S ribosomal protein S1 [Clostridiaceae bacterium]|nr:bifunctional 4-hydroxy-3-methylbut-2-enyl diphosphate reductase/30S ribosomal protein S1 [Clostridiaceae bacterium]
MNIVTAKTAGFCFGVKRAVDMAFNEVKQHGFVYSAGPLIHNDSVLAELEHLGVKMLNDTELPHEGSRVIIRAHGLPKEDMQKLEASGCVLVDATCPKVEKIHDIVAHQSSEGRHILIIGQANHPEVRGIASRCFDFTIACSDEEIDSFIEKYNSQKIAVVCQTTFSTKKYEQFVNKLKNSCNSILFFDTICKATESRQADAFIWASRSDGVIVIGDQKSSNSKNLYELCRSLCGNTVFISEAGQLDTSRFKNCSDIFITAGASTPDSIIKEVNRKMTEENTNINDESFEELLEHSLKTLHTGEKVSGIITQINATDIHVDLGVKQAGYIPMVELSDDPTFNVGESIKIGDEIEAYVMRVNDVEGLIMLSKKRLDAVKNWEKLETAYENKATVEGVIVDQNKGGVIASVMGVRVFIPASQTGLPRDASFDSMMKTSYKMRITEINRQRRRVVGSIKVVSSENRKEAASKIWDNIAVGKVYKGIVKSFTSYGAFVDIGGVDGMVHISELSWNRVKHPSDVLTIGQEVEVYVIALDAEKKKISLGYRRADENPWAKFESTYNKGDVVNVKVVKFMPFGAFAEVLPGVDGLIHISQIVADRRIGKPDEALQIGQMVDVKITDIDSEKKKISLSIRALLDPASDKTAESETAE